MTSDEVNVTLQKVLDYLSVADESPSPKPAQISCARKEIADLLAQEIQVTPFKAVEAAMEFACGDEHYHTGTQCKRLAGAAIAALWDGAEDRIRQLEDNVEDLEDLAPIHYVAAILGPKDGE